MAATSSSVDVELLQDLLDLHECGERVVWPNGLSAEGARKAIMTAKFKQEWQTKPVAGGSAAQAAAAGSKGTKGGGTQQQSFAAASKRSAAALLPLCSDIAPDLYVDAFLCPITQELMTEPVITPSGHSYEGAAIRKVAKELGFSPQTKRRLRATELISNRALADAIEQIGKRAMQQGSSSVSSHPTDAPTPAKQEEAAMAATAPVPATPLWKRPRRVLQAQESTPKDYAPSSARASRG